MLRCIRLDTDGDDATSDNMTLPQAVWAFTQVLADIGQQCEVEDLMGGVRITTYCPNPHPQPCSVWFFCEDDGENPNGISLDTAPEV